MTDNMSLGVITLTDVLITPDSANADADDLNLSYDGAPTDHYYLNILSLNHQL